MRALKAAAPDLFAMPVHAACLLFPTMQGEELANLVSDIKANGLINPIVTHRGAILDGRNRLHACRKAGVEPRSIEWGGNTSPTEWVISVNLHRRHLNATQRAALAIEVKRTLADEAKERQRAGGKEAGRGRAKVSPKLDEPIDSQSAAKAAALTGASRSNVYAMQAVAIKAPEVFDAAKEGKINATQATAIAAMPESDRPHAIAVAGGGKKAAKPTEQSKPRALASVLPKDIARVFDQVDRLLGRVSGRCRSHAMITNQEGANEIRVRVRNAQKILRKIGSFVE